MCSVFIQFEKQAIVPLVEQNFEFFEFVEIFLWILIHSKKKIP